MSYKDKVARRTADVIPGYIRCTVCKRVEFPLRAESIGVALELLQRRCKRNGHTTQVEPIGSIKTEETE